MKNEKEKKALKEMPTKQEVVIEKTPKGITFLDPKTGEERIIKYLEGSPKSYRADCQAGQFKLGESKFLGSNFTIEPIAYRLFNASLWTDSISGIRRDWVEIFFIDDTNSVSAICFHGISRNNLERVLAEKFYEGFGLCEAVVNCFMEKKISKQSGNTYYTVSFELEENPNKEIQRNLGEVIKPFRRDSISPTEILQLAVNYGLQMPELPE